MFTPAQRVAVRLDAPGAPTAWLGLRGQIKALFPSQDAPGGPWEAAYAVRFEDLDEWVMVRESWLVDEGVYDIQQGQDEPDEPQTYLGQEPR